MSLYDENGDEIYPEYAEVPGCCSAFILHGFGEIEYYNYTPNTWMSTHIKPKVNQYWFNDKEELKTNIRRQIKYNNNKAICVVFTNSAMKLVNEVLEEMGFHKTRAYKGENHPLSRVRMWWIGVQEFFEKND